MSLEFSGAGGRLAVHGFVLAGGKSSRMGQDKALLRLGGRTLVEIAVETLRGFCAEVSIAGNRDDLKEFAPVVWEERLDAGPGAGIEAGLRAAKSGWAMFVPVDVPLVPVEMLRLWVCAVMERGVAVSYLQCGAEAHPAICVMRRECADAVSGALDEGERRLMCILNRAAGEGLWVADAAEFSTDAAAALLNVNTAAEFGRADDILGRERCGHE